MGGNFREKLNTIMHHITHARPTMHCISLVGASVSEPHTSKSNCGIFVYVYMYLSVVRIP